MKGDSNGSEKSKTMYCLFDANVIAAYYLPQSSRSAKLVDSARILIESVRSAATKHFFYIPNFCVAEVFNVFMKHTYGHWNKQVKHGTIDGRVHNSLRKQFQKDIHNGQLFYHYELSRYHVLAINLIGPVDHHYQFSRKRRNPAGTLDQLIIGMGMHLTRIHGANNVVIVTADDRIEQIIKRCRDGIGYGVNRKLKLSEAAEFTGIPFRPESFPLVINPKSTSKTQWNKIFGEWPLPLKKKYKKPYLAPLV